MPRDRSVLDDPLEYLNKTEVMRLLKITSRVTLMKYRRDGLPYTRVNRRRFVYPREAVLRWLEQRTRSTGRSAS